MATKLRFLIFTPILISLILLIGCASSRTPLPTPEKVKIQDFMGAWFVHGYTPILVDKAAHNAVEHYYLNAKNEVETTYRFRDGSFTGKLKTYTPTGFPKKDDPSGALWQMQFIWPFKADYVIIYVSEDYQSTIIGHPNRKYAWIMDRSSEIEDETYNALLVKLEDAGYDTSIIKRLPQDWSEETERLERLNAIGADGPLVAR